MKERGRIDAEPERRIGHEVRRLSWRKLEVPSRVDTTEGRLATLKGTVLGNLQLSALKLVRK